jgi:nucleoside-diphosphate-sugar epimerase
MPDLIIHGASGFLGKHFIKKLLSENIPVTVLARRKSDLSFIGESPLLNIFRYTDSLDEINTFDFNVSSPVFYELSWHGVFGSDRNSEEQLSINVPMITSSINLANKFKAKHWIGIGSQAEYGNLNKRISESDFCRPTTMYGKAKLKCSEIASGLCKQFGIEFSWLRLFSVYGPHDNHEWLIQYLIREMLSDNEINVTKGEQVWDYLYIDDISEALFKLKDASGVGVANLGSGKGVQVKYIIEKIRALTHSKSKINYGAVPYREDQVMLMEADITKLSRHLNWSPFIGMEEGIRRTINELKTTRNKKQ